MWTYKIRIYVNDNGKLIMEKKTLQIKNTPISTINKLKKWCKRQGNVDYVYYLETDERLKNL